MITPQNPTRFSHGSVNCELCGRTIIKFHHKKLASKIGKLKLCKICSKTPNKILKLNHPEIKI